MIGYLNGIDWLSWIFHFLIFYILVRYSGIKYSWALILVLGIEVWEAVDWSGDNLILWFYHFDTWMDIVCGILGIAINYFTIGPRRYAASVRDGFGYFIFVWGLMACGVAFANYLSDYCSMNLNSFEAHLRQWMPLLGGAVFMFLGGRHVYADTKYGWFGKVGGLFASAAVGYVVGRGLFFG